MEKIIKLLFVCTGNIFRSASAHYILIKQLEDNNINNIIVSSAGVKPFEPHMHESTENTLKELNIPFNKHVARKLTKEILDENDIIVSMSTDHRDFIEENYGVKTYLFNEIAYGKQTALLDNSEAIEDWQTNKKAYYDYNVEMVKYIHKSMPEFIKNLPKFYPKE